MQTRLFVSPVSVLYNTMCFLLVLHCSPILVLHIRLAFSVSAACSSDSGIVAASACVHARNGSRFRSTGWRVRMF
jgi:hypothetical protein